MYESELFGATYLEQIAAVVSVENVGVSVENVEVSVENVEGFGETSIAGGFEGNSIQGGSIQEGTSIPLQEANNNASEMETGGPILNERLLTERGSDNPAISSSLSPEDIHDIVSHSHMTKKERERFLIEEGVMMTKKNNKSKSKTLKKIKKELKRRSKSKALKKIKKEIKLLRAQLKYITSPRSRSSSSDRSRTSSRSRTSPSRKSPPPPKRSSPTDPPSRKNPGQSRWCHSPRRSLPPASGWNPGPSGWNPGPLGWNPGPSGWNPGPPGRNHSPITLPDPEEQNKYNIWLGNPQIMLFYETFAHKQRMQHLRNQVRELERSRTSGVSLVNFM